MNYILSIGIVILILTNLGAVLASLVFFLEVAIPALLIGLCVSAVIAIFSSSNGGEE